MKKIYIAFFISAIFFSEYAEAQHVQWMNSTVINYSLNPAMPQQPLSISANSIYGARMTDFALDYGVEIFGSMAIECYDLSGWLRWSYPIGDSIVVESITSDPSGNVIVGGAYMETMDMGSSDSLENTGFGFNINLFLFSLDGAGNLNWKRNVTLSHPDAMSLSALGIDNQGNCWYGLAYFDSIAITRLDASGNDLQSHMIIGTRSMNSFSFDPMGNLYATGSTGSTNGNVISIGNFSENVPEPYMMFVTRIDAVGNCSWIELAHDVTFQSPQIVAADNGDAYLAGTLMDGTTFGNVVFDGVEWVYDIFLTRLDSTGNFFWGVEVPHQQTLTGDFSRGRNNFIDVDALGNVYMSGTIRGQVDWGNGVISDGGPIPSYGISIISFDSSGIARWQLSGEAPNTVVPYSIVSTGLDELYFSDAVVGPLTIDSVTTNQGNDFAFVLGKISASTGINEQDGNESLVLYPNPATDKLKITSHKLKVIAGTEISIYNAMGEKVSSTILNSAGTYNYQVDVSVLPPGIYFLSIGDVREKFIVQHQ